jgi:carboxypeptidase C (cathepsin A)
MTLPPFYLMGESYAGVYIPTLTDAILQHNQQPQQEEQSLIVPLRGIAVGVRTHRRRIWIHYGMPINMD